MSADARGPLTVSDAVCVTGMHRSATSLAAMALNALGVAFGDPDLMMEPGPDNTAGYWENHSIKELDDRLLARLGGAWDTPPVLPPGWERSSDLDDLRALAVTVLDESFTDLPADTRWIGWKDPRCSLLLPFWRTVRPITTTILVVRDPAEVALSLHARNGIDAPQAAMLWLRYLLAAAGDDPTHLLVRHDRFFSDLPGVLSDIAAHLGLGEP